MGENEPRPNAVRRWVSRLTADEKDRIIERVLLEGGAQLAPELLQRLGREGEATHEPASVARQRTVGGLLHAAEALAAERSRIAREKTARDKTRLERDAALARNRHLDTLVGKDDAIWRQVDSLIAATKPKAYDEAVTILTDLRDLAARGDAPSFWRRMAALRDRHAGKPSFLRRLSNAALAAK